MSNEDQEDLFNGKSDSKLQNKGQKTSNHVDSQEKEKDAVKEKVKKSTATLMTNVKKVKPEVISPDVEKKNFDSKAKFDETTKFIHEAIKLKELEAAEAKENAAKQELEAAEIAKEREKLKELEAAEAKENAAKEKTAKILALSKKPKKISRINEVPGSEKIELTKKEDRFLVLTHRRNLLSIMSSGLIGPKEVYGKYREDILTQTKGLVPLFSRSISDQLIDLTTSNKDSNFPVVLELDKELLPNTFAFGVNSNGELINNVNKDDSLVFRLSSDVLSTNMIKEVHFASEENINEFVARMFDNVPINDFSLTESPKIFKSKSSFPIEFFKSIGNHEPNNIEYISRVSDKVAASIALLSENMERGSDLKLLHSLLSFPYEGNKSRMRAEYATFAELISTLVTGDETTGKLNEDYQLLSSTLQELINHSPSDGWVALDFLGKIELNYKASIKDDNDSLSKFFETCKSILDLTMDIPDGIFSDDRNIVQRAVLLFLLRPEYGDIIGKENSQLNPGSFVKKIAILITGFRVGYERISTDFKGLHHQIFAPLRAYIINYGLGNRSDNFEKKPKAIVVWNPDERVYTFKYSLLKETIKGELNIKSYIHDVIQKMLDQDHIHEDFEILGGTLDYRFEYLESESKRKQPVNLDFDSVKDNLIISSPCFEITSPTHQKRITKIILQKIFAEDYDGKAYWVFEKKSITLKRVIHHDEIANIDIVDLINFIAKTADEIEEKLFKQDKVR